MNQNSKIIKLDFDLGSNGSKPGFKTCQQPSILVINGSTRTWITRRKLFAENDKFLQFSHAPFMDKTPLLTTFFIPNHKQQWYHIIPETSISANRSRLRQFRVRTLAWSFSGGYKITPTWLKCDIYNLSPTHNTKKRT